MSTGWQVVLLRCRYEPRIIAYLLASLRVAICFWPQTGYLHPDEFFQSTDISAGRYFDSKIHRVWEFTADKPIRCMLIPHCLNYLAFKIATIIQKNPDAYVLLVAPRLIYTIFSFSIDICLYKLCQYYSSRGLWYLPVSIIFQSSFVCLGCLTRTLSNSVEVALFSILLVIVCQTIRPRFRIVFVTPTRTTPVHERVRTSTQLTSSILIGSIITLGTFNRPTFPFFALVPSMYWFSESLKRNSYNPRLTIQRVLVPVTTSAFFTGTLLSTFDTFYYSDYQTIVDAIKYLVQFEFKALYDYLNENWILTPYNFFKFNTNVNNLAEFGLHSPYFHMLVNVPLLFNAIGLMFYGKLISLMVGSSIYRLIFSTHRVYALMLLSTLVSLILFSFIPRHDFRFIIPLIVPLTYMFAFDVYTSNKLLTMWLVVNLTLVCFYTWIHQSGVTKAILDLDPMLKFYAKEPIFSNQFSIDIMAFNCYQVPSYQWNIPSADQRFRFDLHNTFISFNESIKMKLDYAMSSNFNSRGFERKLFLMLPHMHVEELLNYFNDIFGESLRNFKILRQYEFNFNGEILQDSIEYIQKNGFNVFRDAFGYTLVEADIVET